MNWTTRRGVGGSPPSSSRNTCAGSRPAATSTSISRRLKTANGNGNGAAAESNGAGNLQALEIVLRSDLRLTWYRSKQGLLFYKDEVPVPTGGAVRKRRDHRGVALRQRQTRGRRRRRHLPHGGHPRLGRKLPEGPSPRRHLSSALPQEVSPRQREVRPDPYTGRGVREPGKHAHGRLLRGR